MQVVPRAGGEPIVSNYILHWRGGEKRVGEEVGGGATWTRGWGLVEGRDRRVKNRKKRR
jgi:hypothetical protein